MRLLRTVSLLIVLVLLAACSSGSSGSDAGWSGADSAGAEHGPEIDQAADGAAEDADESAAGPREVITTGSLTLVVADTGAAVTQIVALVESDGGRVEGRSEYTTEDERDASAWLTVRVPADDLSATIDRLEELGQATEIDLSSDDVTLRGRDLDARITALETSTERLISLMAEADTSEALIDAEEALSRRQAELESLRSERAYLSDQVAMSTLHINLHTRHVAELEAGGFLGGLENGWNALVTFASGLLVALGTVLPWLAVIGVPAAIVLLLVRRRRRTRPTPPSPEPTPA
ncbi:MAG TPA: DUF4349 domain-containing protein [Actinomycetaceae bacterium]|nr:DUF4349 domain-containing protein [Actinomycetaceae bacterium]